MKILVTGAAGFIGSKLMYTLRERGDEVVGIDNFNDYYDVRLKEGRCKAFAGEGEEAGGGIAGVDFDGVVVAAADEDVAAVGGDVEVARMGAGGRVADVVQEAAGADFEDDDAVAAKAEARVKELAVRREVDVRGAASVHAVGLDDLFLAQGAIGIVIDRVVGIGTQCCYGIGHRSVNRLALTIDIIIVAVRIALSATNISNTISCCHCRIIYHIRIGIRKIGCLGPVGLDGNGSHTFRHIPIGTLVEDTATDGVEILVGTVAVGKVIGSSGNLTIGINCCIIATSKATSGTTCDAGNLPACHHAVASIVLGTHFIIVGQLYLSIIEVEMVGVFIGDV